jgi:uncharacterized membrane protein
MGFDWLVGLHIPAGLVPSSLLWIGNLLFVMLLGAAIWRVDWKSFVHNDEQQHVFFGAMVMLLTLWGIKAGISPGLGFHHLGATLFTLMFGWTRALIGLSVVLAASLVLQAQDWPSFGVNGLLSIAIPVMISYAILKLSQKLLPDNFFIYVFVCAFFGAATAAAASRLSAIALLSLIGAYSDEKLIEESLQFLPLFMFPEAFVTGMLISIFVVYKPDWVTTFDDDRYIRGK